MSTRTLTRLFVTLTLALAALLLVNHSLARSTDFRSPGDFGSLTQVCFGSIQACIDAANDGDTIVIPAGTYTESLTLSKPVSLTGVNSSTTIIHAVANQRVLTVTGATISTSVVISGLTFTGGNASTFGGGLLIDTGAHPTLRNVIVFDNRAGTNGGGLYASSAAIMVEADFISNTALTGGGGLEVNAPLAISGGRFLRNTSANGGGILVGLTGQLEVTGTQFISNTATSHGGAIETFGPLTISQATLEDNHIVSPFGIGGAVFGDSVPLNITHSTFRRHNGSAVGVNAGSIAVIAGRFEANTGTYGGGLRADNAPVTLIDTDFLSNTAQTGGAGVATTRPITITRGRFENNLSTAYYGGGLYAQGLALISGTHFISNAAPSGGGLYAQDTAFISATQFISNAATSGGGLYLAGLSGGHIVNTLLAGNTSVNDGAALYLASIGTTDIAHATIAGVSRNPQSAVRIIAGTVRLTDTIIASHTVGIRNGGGTATEDYTLFFGNITHTVGVTSGGYSLVGDPRFIDLVHDDYHLRLGSAAIDHGIDAGVYTDLDGHHRPSGSGFDIGAYEYVPNVRFVATTGQDDGNNCTDSATPCATLQHAIDAANPLDEVRVATGVYTDVQVRPRNDITTTGIVTQVAYLSQTVTIRGGYTTTDWLTSNPISYPTTLDAQGQGRGVYITGDITPTIEGMRLTNGTGASSGNYCEPFLCLAPGGAVYAVSATVKLTDSIVDNNAGGYEGAAIFIHDGHASLSNNLIMSNTAGGALLFNSDGLINENRIVGNTAGNGGGVLILSGTATLLHNDILSNTAAYACGGGVCIAYSSTVTLTHNAIQGNTAIAYGGGGVGISYAQAMLRDNLIEGNLVNSWMGYSDGGGVSIDASSRAELIGNTIRANAVSGSNWARGGGVSVNANSAVTMTDNTIQDNSSNQVGGGVYLEGTTNVLSHNTLVRNHADNQGGGLYAANAITLLDTSVISNTAINDGGGAFLNGPAAIINGRFENNLCLNSDSCSGGGLYTIETLSLTDTQFISNAAGYAGGLDAVVKPVSIVGGQFERNTSQHFGGGLLALYGTVFMSGTVITGNIALDGYGGGVYAYDVTLLGARFINNVAAGLSGFGGGLNADFARIIDTLFIGNTASDAGGANAGHGYVIGGQFERNTSTLGNGGGLVAGYLFITGTRFISNNAFHSGGGVLIIDTGRIVNAVLANNTTQGDGAAVSIGSGGGVDVIHTTIAATNLNPKPAISILSGPVHLTDTIIASHTIGIDNSGGSVTEDYNLFFGNITNTVGVTSGGHSLVGDPRFVDLLHDNYHLLSNSPAIDHGIDAGVYTDLDGHPRPFGPGFDIGAYEFQGPFSRVYLPLVHK